MNQLHVDDRFSKALRAELIAQVHQTAPVRPRTHTRFWLGGGAVATGNNDAEMARFHDPEGLDKQLISLTRCNMRDFVRALETHGQPASNIDQGVTSSSCAILANIAMDLKRSLTWDGTHIVGDVEAQKRSARAYRAPWKHPVFAV